MAYSSITIDFLTVPNFNEVLNISENKLGLNLNEVFKDARTTAGTVKIPPFYEYDGIHPERYIGYISNHYKSSFDLDFNATNLFTITATNGPVNEGTGQVIITANYSDAVFVLGTSTANVTVTINNQTFTPPPAGVITFSPTALNFRHEQNTAFEEFGIAMSGDLWKVVGKPNFVLSSTTAGVTMAIVTDGTGTYQTVTGSGNAIVSITPTAYYDGSGTFLPADLAGSFAVLKNNAAYGTIAFTMEVTRISDFLTNPYLATAKAFTLDPKFFEFRSTNLDTYFQFDSTIKTYDFFTNAVNEYLIPLKIVLFKGYAKENLGQIIHRLMRKFTDVNDSLLQYKQATLKITCSEINIADTTVVRSGTMADIPIIAGLSRGITNVGFLDFNPAPNRVTKNSFAYLNILIPAGSYELRTFKNGILLNSLALPASTGVVLCKKVLFSDFEKGDLIQYVIDVVGQTNALAPKKTYILFPDNNYSNMIVWENEFLVQSAMECTGSASIDPEGEFQSQTVFIDLVERLEHLSSSKMVKLYINTGWLLFSDIDTVESLMRSKRAWLLQGNTTISLRPISKKLPKKDLEEELISYPLEFQINQKYNEETYSL
ncbi:hypothetical protein ACNQGP_00910 [Flavobacterium sp. GT2N3]|uniref:hypothetical protein n=1 Tax=unclassified Flavobacterium TaxID=196869 RepID=UPI003AAEF34A